MCPLWRWLHDSEILIFMSPNEQLHREDPYKNITFTGQTIPLTLYEPNEDQRSASAEKDRAEAKLITAQAKRVNAQGVGDRLKWMLIGFTTYGAILLIGIGIGKLF